MCLKNVDGKNDSAVRSQLQVAIEVLGRKTSSNINKILLDAFKSSTFDNCNNLIKQFELTAHLTQKIYKPTCIIDLAEECYYELKESRKWNGTSDVGFKVDIGCTDLNWFKIHCS
eukprot:8812633-Ditylum_brightwellii.AAC.1